ncbi:InlB B-repeat-containing protein [Anaerococcus hydrogenalis]|uniref:Atypical Rib domain-containing protein n=1 Tax=Anaerococcus hydrogenalis TaxID=33029 RepID=A0A2N6UJ45_9FIRM|nr:InlB B-repeat-containing protein [Anaerococcus hydrogenalis]PMC81777.1 hypothetical protein CJ192_03200 [Anaerococcus hydrogenalis]
MKKYKKNRVIFEEKVFDKKRKPVYGTRKLSVGLVSCMLGFMMFLPTSKASEEDTISTNQQVEDKVEVSDKKDNFVQEEKEEVTPLNDQTDSKVDSEENLSVQNLDGQNKEEGIIKEENSDSKIEDKDEELLTADEIQAIRARTDSLENDYYFNDNMVEELKAELRKAKDDPSVNYEEAKARLIEEAIVKNTPKIKPAGEERATIPEAPTISKVFYDATTISGGKVHRGKIGGKTARGTIYVTLKDKDGVVKATLSVTPTSGTIWTVNLPQGVKVAEGDVVTAYQEFDGKQSTETTANAQPSKASSVTLTMPSGEIWIEQTSSNQVNADEQAEAVQMLKDANTEIAGDIKSVEFSIDGTDHAYYEVTYTDKSTSGKVEATDLKIKTVTETSAAPTIEKVQVTDGQIIVTLEKEVAAGTKFYFVKQFTDGEDKGFCEEGKCKVDKSTSQDMSQAVSVDGKKVTFQINAADDLELGRNFGIVVKEPHKFRSCAISQPVLTTPAKVDVRDPHKLTEEEKKAIDKAIRDANTTEGGVSKLPDGTGFISDKAFIEFDKDGNVTIISPNDVEVDWDSDGNPIYEKNPDGTYKLQSGRENNVTKFLAKDLVKNIKPKPPTVAVDTDTGKVTITPPAYEKPGDDTDLASYTVTYKDASGAEKTVTATRDLDKNIWSGPGVDENTGMITLSVKDIEVGGTIKATAKDNGGLEGDTTKLDSEPSTKTLETATISYDPNSGTGDMESKVLNKGSEYTVLPNAFTAPDDTQEFDAWEVDGKRVEPGTEIKVNDNTVVKALWKKIKVKVIYDGNGGSGDMTGEEVDKGSGYTVLPNAFTAPDDTQEFDAWEVDGKRVEPGTEIKIDKDTVIKAIWKKIQVNVTYDGNGGKGTMAGKTVDKGSNYTVLENTFNAPDETQEFDTWEVNGEKVAAGTSIKIDKDTVIKAIWKKIQVKVSYDANGGSGNMAGATQNKGSKYTLLANTFKAPNENQEFKIWEVNGQEVAPGSEITLDKDTVVKAIWKDIEVKVSYEPNGGSGEMKGAIQKKGTKYTLSSNTFTAPENQEFDTWEVDGQKLAPNAEITLDKDTIVKAIWKDIEYKVTFNGNTGTGSMPEKLIKKGNEYELPANGFTAPENKIFSHWKIGNEDKNPGDKITVNGDTEVIAIWKDDKVKVSYDGNGGTGSMEGKELVKGSPYKLSANGFTAPENKEFAGWKIGETEYEPDTEINVNEDTTVTAIWKDIKVKVSYDANGGSGSMDGTELTKGSTYKLSSNKFTAPTNKEFAGWKIGDKEYTPDAEITVNEDTEVKAIWKDIKVKVSYNSNGGSGTMDGAEVTKGSTYKLLANTFTAPENKEFDRWEVNGEKLSPNSEITVDKDTVITAIWKNKTPETPPVTEKVKVIYESNGGSGSMEGKELTKGSKYTLSANGFTAPENKKFKAWKIGDTEYAVGAEIIVNENTTATAVWEDIETTPPAKEEVQVSYDPGEGSGTMNGAKLEKGSKYILSANGFEAPDKKKFKGWKIGDTEYAAGDEITVDKDTTVTAVWEDIKITPPAKEKVQVSYEPGEGTGSMDRVELTKGSKYTLLANSFKAPDKKKFKGWKIGDKEYSAGEEITINENTIVTAIWEDIKITPPVTEKVQVSYEPGEGTGSMDRVELTKGSKYTLSTNGFKAPANKKFKAWKIGDREYAEGEEITVNENTTVTAIWEDIEVSPNPGTNSDEGDNPENPGTRPGEGDNPDKPGTRPGEGDNPDKPGTRPGEGDNPDNPGTRPGEGNKPGENPRPRTKPNGRENNSKTNPSDDKITKKPEDNKENSLNNRKVQVTRTNDVKENVQTGVESLGKIGGILSAAIAGLFASKKRKK